MRRFYPELIALPLLPLLILQGRHTRRVTPRLPEAAGPSSGIVGVANRGTAFSLLTLGESPVAGVGVAAHDEAITGQLAYALSDALQCPVSWRAHGKNGVTAGDALEQVVPLIPEVPVDLALVAFGVNDTSTFRSVRRWRSDLMRLLAALDARCAPTQILLSGVPPVADFPALPQPLRWVLGLKAQALDLAAREVAAEMPHVLYVPLALNTQDRSMMASDGYHPSATGCTAWAQLLVHAYVTQAG